MLYGLRQVMHFAGPQFSYLLNGSNSHKGGAGLQWKRGGVAKPQNLGHQCNASVCCQTLPGLCQFCPLSVSPDQEKATSDSREPVSWDSEELVRTG